MEGPNIRERLRAQRETLLEEEIDWESWNPEASQRLALLDYLLDV